MRLLLCVLTACFSLFSTAQQVSFFKDYNLTKEVAEKKANYKKVETTKDNILKIDVYNIKKNCIVSKEIYKETRPVGIWESYSPDCVLEKRRDFTKLRYVEKGVDTLSQYNPTPGNPGNHQPAKFGNEANGLFAWISQHITYPLEAKENGISGTVYLQFVVNAEGAVEVVAIVRGADPFLDYETWTLIQNMPPWTPATIDGKAVPCLMTLPVKFVLK